MCVARTSILQDAPETGAGAGPLAPAPLLDSLDSDEVEDWR